MRWPLEDQKRDRITTKDAIDETVTDTVRLKLYKEFLISYFFSFLFLVLSVLALSLLNFVLTCCNSTCVLAWVVHLSLSKARVEMDALVDARRHCFKLFRLL